MSIYPCLSKRWEGQHLPAPLSDRTHSIVASIANYKHDTWRKCGHDCSRCCSRQDWWRSRLERAAHANRHVRAAHSAPRAPAPTIGWPCPMPHTLRPWGEPPSPVSAAVALTRGTHSTGGCCTPLHQYTLRNECIFCIAWNTVSLWKQFYFYVDINTIKLNWCRTHKIREKSQLSKMLLLCVYKIIWVTSDKSFLIPTHTLLEWILPIL